jgi:hypothetical protein
MTPRMEERKEVKKVELSSRARKIMEFLGFIPWQKCASALPKTASEPGRGRGASIAGAVVSAASGQYKKKAPTVQWGRSIGASGERPSAIGGNRPDPQLEAPSVTVGPGMSGIVVRLTML